MNESTTTKRFERRLEAYLLRQDVEEAVACLRRAMKATRTVRRRNAESGRIEYVPEPDFTTQFAAGAKVLEHAIGKPTQRVEQKIDSTQSQLPANPDQLRDLLAADKGLAQRIMADYIAALEPAGKPVQLPPSDRQSTGSNR